MAALRKETLILRTTKDAFETWLLHTTRKVEQRVFDDPAGPIHLKPPQLGRSASKGRTVWRMHGSQGGASLNFVISFEIFPHDDTRIRIIAKCAARAVMDYFDGLLEEIRRTWPGPAVVLEGRPTMPPSNPATRGSSPEFVLEEPMEGAHLQARVQAQAQELERHPYRAMAEPHLVCQEVFPGSIAHLRAVMERLFNRYCRETWQSPEGEYLSFGECRETREEVVAVDPPADPRLALYSRGGREHRRTVDVTLPTRGSWRVEVVPPPGQEGWPAGWQRRVASIEAYEQPGGESTLVDFQDGRRPGRRETYAPIGPAFAEFAEMVVQEAHASDRCAGAGVDVLEGTMKRILTMYYRGTAGQLRAAMQRVMLLHRPAGWTAPTGEKIGWGEDMVRKDWSARGSWDVIAGATPEPFDDGHVRGQERRFLHAGIEAFEGPGSTTVEFLDGYTPPNSRAPGIGPAFDAFARWLAGELGLSATPRSPAPQSEQEAGQEEGARKGKREPLGLHGGTLGRVREARALIEAGECKKTKACRRAGVDPRTYDRYVEEVIDWSSWGEERTEEDDESDPAEQRRGVKLRQPRR